MIFLITMIRVNVVGYVARRWRSHRRGVVAVPPPERSEGADEGPGGRAPGGVQGRSP
jgi:hypothetical protein